MKTYTIDKHKDTFYVDYDIQNGKCFIVQEFHSRVLTTFVCKTDKKQCDDLQETSNQIIITI